MSGVLDVFLEHSTVPWSYVCLLMKPNIYSHMSCAISVYASRINEVITGTVLHKRIIFHYDFVFFVEINNYYYTKPRFHYLCFEMTEPFETLRWNNEGDPPRFWYAVFRGGGVEDGTQYAKGRYAVRKNPVISYANNTFFLKVQFSSRNTINVVKTHLLRAHAHTEQFSIIYKTRHMVITVRH